ncbi:PREDICTED: serine/threonine-protein kinase pdik1l-like [Ficedula albicollis]|uniref:serine/threonine-protein kinase pdik1l-like n=1 Tax=Ficedula albicollis TaxID=59894 RepID=UPI0007AD7857|nr:PREDICTED: serine/threonine-protein kinase pdik1l-like [Ficedula albicollis]
MAEEEAKYSILQEVGRGSYGVVYEAVANRTKRRVAVKRMHCNAPGNAELALQELRALQPNSLFAGTYICQGEELIPLGEALLENPNLKLQIPLKNKKSMPEDLCQLLHHMLSSNPKERLDASQLEVQIQQISYGKKRKHSGS